MSERTDLERAIARAFRPDKRMSRRSFLRQTGRGALVAGSTLSIASILAACGIRPGCVRGELRGAHRTPPARSSGRTGRCTSTSTTTATTRASSPSPRRRGIEVNYTEAIQDNADFMGVILPDLQAGQRHRLGRHHARRLGGRAPARGSRCSRSWTTASCRTGRRTRPTTPRASGSTPTTSTASGGRAASPASPTIPSSPAARSRRSTTCSTRRSQGVAGAFSDMRDMFGLTLLSLGVEPANATVDDVTRARDKLLEANGRNQFRGYYGNEYYDALADGRPRDLGRLVRRHHADAAERQRQGPVRHPAGRGDALERQLRDPEGRVPHPGRPQAHGLLLRRPGRDDCFRSTSATSPG